MRTLLGVCPSQNKVNDDADANYNSNKAIYQCWALKGNLNDPLCSVVFRSFEVTALLNNFQIILILNIFSCNKLDFRSWSSLTLS